MKDSDSVYAIAYKNPDLTYKNNRFQVDALIVMGWLLCRHWDDEQQEKELWHILNPTLQPDVSINRVVLVLMQLLHIACDLNKKLIRTKAPSKEKDQAINYLDLGINNKGLKKQMLDSFKKLSKFGADKSSGLRVDKETILKAFQPYFRTSKIRMMMAE